MLTQRSRTLTLVLGLLAALSLGASAQSLTTTFAGGNSFNGNMFDIKALNSVIITSFDVNFVGTADFEIWAITGGGTYLGNQGSGANWTLLGSANGVTSLGTGVATPLPITTNLLVPAGQVQGLYVTLKTGTMNYTNGTVQGALYASNADLEFYEGHGGGYPFNLTNVPRIWNGTIYYTIQVAQTDDMQMVAVTAPAGSAPGCSQLSATETITCRARSLGSNPVLAGSLIDFNLTIDGGTTITESFFTTTALNLGDTIDYTFLATPDLSANGSHTIDVSVTYPGDLDPSNDMASLSVMSGGLARITSYPHVENFDSANANNTTVPVAGWAQDNLDGAGLLSDWYLHQGPTPTAGTGPATDHTTGAGYFAFIDDRGAFSSVNLISPCFDLSTLVTPRLAFWLHSQNGNATPTTSQNFFSVDVAAYPGGAVTVDAIGPLGDQGAGWNYQVLDLTPFAGQTVQFVFRGQSNNGGVASSLHDIAIDDVAVYEPQTSIGQAPQPGVAVLDINGGININAEPVSLGFNGPYFASVSVGSNMAIQINGEPGAAIAFLAGPLTPVAATYPNVGQLDIGGAVNPMTGIPGSIVVIGDGFNPSSFINAIFNTGPAGQLNLGFQIPPLPLGPLAAFQALNSTSNGFFFGISNAVDVTIN